MKNGLHEMMESIDISDEHMQKVIKQSANVIRKKKKRIEKLDFFIIQICYIRSMFWLWQLFAILIGLLLSGYCITRGLNALMHFVLSFSVIVVHILSVPVLLKSVDCETIELENTTYIPYRYALLSKIIWIGLSNLFFISIFMLLTTGIYKLSLEQILFYMLVPYNFTCLISLVVVYLSRHAQGIYYCVTSNILFSILLFLFSNTKYYIESSYLLLWKILFSLSVGMLFIAIYKVLQQADHKEVTLYERRRVWN